MNENGKSELEQCKALLIEMRLERRKADADFWLISELQQRVMQFPARTVALAFDRVVDECGWGEEGVFD